MCPSRGFHAKSERTSCSKAVVRRVHQGQLPLAARSLRACSARQACARPLLRLGPLVDCRECSILRGVLLLFFVTRLLPACSVAVRLPQLRQPRRFLPRRHSTDRVQSLPRKHAQMVEQAAGSEPQWRDHRGGWPCGTGRVPMQRGLFPRGWSGRAIVCRVPERRPLRRKAIAPNPQGRLHALHPKHLECFHHQVSSSAGL